jgi:solute carrier family 45 protein 1/2/4
VVRVFTQVNSIIWFTLLNVAIQPLQMASRAIIIENNDTSDQVAAGAWASLMQGIGSILGFLLGSIPLSEVLPLGLAANFSILCLLGSVLLLTTAFISASVIEENSDSAAPYLQAETNAVGGRSIGFIEGVASMPREVWRIFAVQFFAWLGWFPFRTYYTRYAL